ncbi:MAG: hypothetical protein ABI239_01935 [Aquihabitans sp.]
MRRGLMRVVWAVATPFLWSLNSLLALGLGLLPMVLIAIVVGSWGGVALTRGRNWFAIVLAIGVTASFVPVIRREWSNQRSARAEAKKP